METGKTNVKPTRLECNNNFEVWGLWIKLLVLLVHFIGIIHSLYLIQSGLLLLFLLEYKPRIAQDPY